MVTHQIATKTPDLLKRGTTSNSWKYLRSHPLLQRCVERRLGLLVQADSPLAVMGLWVQEANRSTSVAVRRLRVRFPHQLKSDLEMHVLN